MHETYLNRVKSLSNVLRDLTDVFPERSLTDEQTASLEDIFQGCNKVLQDLDACLDNYQELSDKASHAHAPLGTKSRRSWKRLKFEPDDVKDLRSRLQSHVGMLHAFIERIDMYVSSNFLDIYEWAEFVWPRGKVYIFYYSADVLLDLSFILSCHKLQILSTISFDGIPYSCKHCLAIDFKVFAGLSLQRSAIYTALLSDSF